MTTITENTNIDCFSPEVCKELEHYVYRLIDPRNGQTFYVGKGVGNRVFAHINEALNNYKNENYIEKDEVDEPESLKLKRIRDIKKAGLNVIHLIHRYGMNEEAAFEVESALIDCFEFNELTNLQQGHNHYRGVQNAYTLQKLLSVSTYEERDDISYMIIKTSQERIDTCMAEKHITLEEGIYEATRYAWKINPQRANNCQYVLGVIDGIVKGVYQPICWKLNEYGDRYEFEGKKAPESIEKYFLNKRIPNKYTKKGAANPIQYHNA